MGLSAVCDCGASCSYSFTVFCCNPQIIFVTFLQFGLSQLLKQLLQMHIYTGNLVNATPPTI